MHTVTRKRDVRMCICMYASRGHDRGNSDDKAQTSDEPHPPQLRRSREHRKRYSFLLHTASLNDLDLGRGLSLAGNGNRIIISEGIFVFGIL